MSAIHIKSPALTIKAGHSALRRIQRDGLQPQDVGIIPGAAGGPKPLGIQGLDIALFGDWLNRAPRPRTLIGASIGAWRFASACLPDAALGLRRLAELYTAQRFAKGVSMQQVSHSCERMLDQLLGEQSHSLLSKPDYHLNILTVRSQGLLRHDHKAALGLGLACVVGNNWLGRARLGKHFQRVIFHDARQAPPLDTLSDFTSRYTPLASNNLRAALLASGSIPMIMQGVRDIPGAGPGTYRDGGLLDYHLDLPYQGEDIVLYPHFTDKVIPGWFDKTTPWRRGDGQRLRNVLLLAPSPEYLARLPYGKLPDRNDFHRFVGADAQREQYWRQAISASQRLGDEFLELVETGRIAEHLQAL
jgi:hypothetical protein